MILLGDQFCNDLTIQRFYVAERSETTRKQLLEATAKLIRQKGFGGLRTTEVASLAGVSRGALLHHFPSKHALVVGVLTYVNEFTFAQSKLRAELARTTGDPIEEIIKDAQDFFLGDYFFIEPFRRKERGRGSTSRRHHNGNERRLGGVLPRYQGGPC